MKKMLLSLSALLLTLPVKAQSPSGYNELEAVSLMKTIQGTPFERTTHPEAQWYPKAGLGLFIHWGIHCVTGTDPSWSMLSNVPWLKNDPPVKPQKYYKLAEEFQPGRYDAEKWVLAAKNAGFQYVVITAKHHDGYCLWPTNHGTYNTKNYMQGRDLLRPLVDACRKYGLRIGLYFSPRDWSNPDYPMPFKDHDYAQQIKGNRYPDGTNQRQFDKFFDYTVGQLSELLTRYGKIDVIWFDGIDWPGVNTHYEKLHAWLRALQPEIIINPRWETNEEGKSFGDFRTEEIAWRKRMTEGRPYAPGVWWEFNETWSGHWGYSPGARFRDINTVIAALVYARSYGGNYLPDVGPQPDGEMRPGFYDACVQLGQWMDINKESVVGTSDFDDWNNLCNVPLTRRGSTVYAHLLKDLPGEVKLQWKEKPRKVVLLSDGKEVPYSYKKGQLLIRLEQSRRGSADDVVKMVFE
ncbi:MAG: alpha-L-fucosidase [Prevotella sp.]|nr:alpha-L-fucosidase [Prevotella sp.]